MLLGGGGKFRVMPHGSLQAVVAGSLRGLWGTNLCSLVPGHEVSTFAPFHTPAMIGHCLAIGSKATGVDHGGHSKPEQHRHLFHGQKADHTGRVGKACVI